MDKLDLIKERCEKAGLQTRITVHEFETFLDEEESQVEAEQRRHLIVAIPKEREYQNIVIVDSQEIDIVAESSFEKFKFLKDYEGIWSADLKTIECEIQSDEQQRSPLVFFKSLLRYLNQHSAAENDRYVFPSPNDHIKIVIGYSSIEFAILSNYKSEFLFSTFALVRLPTIRLENIEVKTHDEARALLLKLANTVLFQIDVKINTPIHLVLDRNVMKGIRRRKFIRRRANFSPPKFEYDEQAMSLYWYARTAINMPLLQYLAFYQILEYYFPTFSYKEAHQKIQNLIKDPVFDVNNDGHISQIVNLLKFSAKGRAIGDERAQLKAAIYSIIDHGTLLGFLLETEERKDFFDVGKKGKSLAKQKISFVHSDNDIRPEIANRIYEIRCRIVHTKDDDEFDLILPFSSDLVHLRHDLELVEFLARKALVATCRPLKLQ